MESSDEEEEAEFRHLLEENTNTPSTQRRGHYTNSILSAAVSSLCPYKRGPQKFTTAHGRPNDINSGEFIKARRVEDLSAEEVKSSTKKIMSLPFTVVSSARGTRELLDLTRLHYVTHRLALGEEGLEDMIAAEKKIVGHSIFANTSSLAVLAMPVMDFEEGAQANGTANQLVQNDPTVRKHLQDMDIAIETMRAEKLDEVRIMDCSMFHSKRRQCLNNMQERAMMMDSSLQDVLFDGINRTDDICSHNPGFNELEIIRAGTATVNFNSSPSLMKMETKVSPRSIHFASESEAEADAKDKIEETMQADSPAVSPRSVASLPHERQASLEHDQDLSKKENSATTLVLQGTESYTSVPVAGIDPQESLATDSGATHQFSSKKGSSYWGKAQDSVYKRSERWTTADRRRRPGKSLAIADPTLTDMMCKTARSMITESQKPPVLYVYSSRCLELGVTPNSAVMESLEKPTADISYARIGDRGAEAFASALSVSPIITKLSLRDNRLGLDGLTHILQSLLSRMQFTAAKDLLHAEDPPMASQAAQIDSITARSVRRHQQLIELLQDPGKNSMNNTVKHPTPSSPRQKEEKALSSGVCPLTFLNVSSNSIGDGGACLFALVLDPRKCPSQLCELLLDNCRISDAGGCALMMALKANDVLQTLSLRHNKLCTATASAMGEILLQNTVLKNIDLSWNALGPAAGASLAKGLSHNLTLQSLNLSWNGLEALGSAAIFKALAENRGLICLNVSSTRTSNSSCVHLATALRKNSTLEQLIVNNNGLSSESEQLLVQALNVNRTLNHLDLKSHAIVMGGSNDENSVPFFNPAHPEGVYLMNLSLSRERDVAVHLITASKAHEEGPLMKDIVLDGAPHSSVPDSWPGELPDKGTLECIFLKNPDSPGIIVLDWKKIGALDANFRKPTVSESAKLSTVLALAPCSNFYAAQISHLLKNFETGDSLITAACSLYVKCMDLEDGVDTIMGSVPARDVRLIKERLGYRIGFRGSNPTGHYSLDLNVPHQYLLAIRLADEATREGSVLTWRNILYQRGTDVTKHYSSAGPPIEWPAGIPNTGNLTFDFVTHTKPADGVTAASNAQLTAALEACGVQFSRPGGKAILPEVQELRPESVLEWRAQVCLLWLTTQQIVRAVECFSASPDRVEVVVSSWGRCVDRDNFWMALYCLSGLEQSVAITRLGPSVVLKCCPQNLSYHWLLDWRNPEHEEVALHLIKEAQGEDMQNWFNLLLSGRSKTFPENQAMLGFLTTSSKHPIMHLNTLFQDSWESVCKAKASAIDDMTSHEKTAVRVKAAQRLKLQYLLQISPYFESEEEDRSLIPSFCSSEALKRTGPETAPWEAVWHRTIRFLVRLRSRDTEAKGASPLQEWFFQYTNESMWMDRPAFEAWAKECGHTSSACLWLSKQMSNLAAEKNAFIKGHSSDITYKQFSLLLRMPVPKALLKTAAMHTNTTVKQFINKIKAATLKRMNAEKS